MDTKVLYLCDRKKCPNCHKICKHTTDITHAATFNSTALGAYFVEQQAEMPPVFDQDKRYWRKVAANGCEAAALDD